jgi:hypothetical protein
MTTAFRNRRHVITRALPFTILLTLSLVVTGNGQGNAAPTVDAGTDPTPTNAELADALDPVQAWGASNADIYAGVFLDDVQAFLAVTSPGDPRLADIVADFPYPGSLTVVPATFTLARLTEIQHELDARGAQLRAAGLPLNSTSLDVRRNVVSVGVDSVTAAGIAALAAQYGDAVTFVEQRVEPAVSLVPGGSAISGGGYGCTAAFNLYDSALLTAGHCFPMNAYVSYNNYPFGKVTKRVIGTGTVALAADVELVDFSSSLAPTDNVMHDDYCTTCAYHVDGVDTTIVSGENLCHIGRTTGMTCGTVLSTSYSPCYSGTADGTQCYYDMKTATNDYCPGDSGGPVFYARTAKGIVSGRTYSTDNPGCGQGDGIFSGMAGIGQYVDLARIHVG